jgi:spore maturation protein CgeB
MIIHLVGAQQSNYPWGFENRLIPAIHELGHTLISTDFRQERARLPELLQQKADLLLVCKGEGLDPQLIESSPCVTALWYAEQIGNIQTWDVSALARRKELVFNLAAFDYAFSHDPSNLSVYQKLGGEKVSSLPCAAVDPALNRKLNIPKKYDVVFVGSKTARRSRLLDTIRQKGITVYNPDIWNADETNRLFNESRIVLNLHLSDLLNTETRVAEVLGAGSLLLSETLSDPDLVRDGEHFVSFPPGNMDELAIRVLHYLDHETERETIAARGHDYFRHHHSFARRIQQIIDTVDFSVNSRIWPAYVFGVPTNRQGKPTRRLDRFNAQVRELLSTQRHIPGNVNDPEKLCLSEPIKSPEMDKSSGQADHICKTKICFEEVKLNLDKYKNDGWAISRLGFAKLYELIENNPKDVIRILEFGSGISTIFFSDLSTILDKEIYVTSFDNDLGYMYSDTSRKNVLVHLRELEETDDSKFDQMFEEKTYHHDFMHIKATPLTTRQRNNFYSLRPRDLDGIYDYMLLDGPNGNGRSLAFLHVQNHLSAGSVVFIDDFTHYDFVDKFRLVFTGNEVFKHIGGSIDRWNSGGDFIIFKIDEVLRP